MRLEKFKYLLDAGRKLSVNFVIQNTCLSSALDEHLLALDSAMPREASGCEVKWI